jgi:predicted nucleic acid-binding protein
MIIISDTTPLRYLIEIEEAPILQVLYGKIIIPQRVFDELQGQHTPPKVVQWIQQAPIWIEVRQADTSLFTPQRRIQQGEHEAIALALELQAAALLVDDSDAIKEAHRLNLPTIRLFTILESAAELELLDLPSAITRMRQTTFRLPPSVIIDALIERDRLRKLNQGISPG